MSSDEIVLNDSQRDVVEAPVDDRLLVIAAEPVNLNEAPLRGIY